MPWSASSVPPRRLSPRARTRGRRGRRVRRSANRTAAPGRGALHDVRRRQPTSRSPRRRRPEIARHLRQRMPRAASQTERLRDLQRPIDEVRIRADERDVNLAAGHQVVQRDHGFQRGDTTAHDHDLHAVAAMARGCNLGGHALTVTLKPARATAVDRAAGGEPRHRGGARTRPRPSRRDRPAPILADRRRRGHRVSERDGGRMGRLGGPEEADSVTACRGGHGPVGCTSPSG